MRERPTARVLLLDPEDRLLMMRGRLPSNPTGPSFWFTVGGGVEPGETPHQAAEREIVEETGLTDAVLGPTVWYDESVLKDAQQQPMLLQQHYILARTDGGPLSREGWQEVERELIDDLRWWRLDEIATTSEALYPEGLIDLLPDVLAGRIGAQPLVIRTVDGVVRPLPRP